MSNTTPKEGSVTAVLTDGTGVAPITGIKVLKDLVLDFLLTGASALGAGATLEALDIGTVLTAPDVAVIGIVGALVKALYRAALRWASS